MRNPAVLTILPGDGESVRAGLTRRDLLRIGTVSLGGLSLSSLLAARAATSDHAFRDKAVVLLFLAGGASHIETFDPRMDAPDRIRSTTGEVATTIAGVTFGGTFPRLASFASRFVVVRSFGHRVNDHAKAIQHVLTAGNLTGASVGSIYAKIRGPEDPETAMPTYGLVTTEEIDDQYQKELKRVRESSGPGPFGRAYGPFDPWQGGGTLDLMHLTIPRDRFHERRTLLSTLDNYRRKLDSAGAVEAMGRHQQTAFDLILRNAGSALDLAREDPRIVSRYDTGNFRVGYKRKRPCTLGRQLLTARRLIEAGCGFVTVQNAGWDMHADVNNPGIKAGMEMLGPPLDHALGAFIEDLGQRGLAEKVLVVVTGDFGRTPKINARGGRDHWAPLSTLALAGGGLKTGQVIGESDKGAGAPAAEPVSPGDLLATIMHVLCDISQVRVRPGVPREILAALDAGQPIRDVL
jgi:hypothetical protein